MPPLAIGFCAQIHRHYHATSRHPMLYHATGLAYSALAGMSWVLYRQHHANHHRFNNGPGDWAKTTDAGGQYLPGWHYLLKQALRPFAFQLIPFLSILGMRPEKRSALAWLDESCRCAVRLVALLVFGPGGLVLVLTWQAIFLVAIMYLNYLQHFEIPEGRGVVWEARAFNFLTSQLGYHDQHHAQPAISQDIVRSLPARVTPRGRIGLFNPVIFAAFITGPAHLAKYLLDKPAAQRPDRSIQ